jgi:hypothetical protein
MAHRDYGTADQNPPHSGEVARTLTTCPSQPPQTCVTLIELPHDVLDPIVGFVAENRKHLLNMCLASKVLYLNCIPWIYRHVEINFSDPESYILLRRLCYASSQIPTYVRSITLKSCEQASMDQCMLFIQTLSHFTRLENVRWEARPAYPNLCCCTLTPIILVHQCRRTSSRCTMDLDSMVRDSVDLLSRTISFPDASLACPLMMKHCRSLSNMQCQHLP